MGARSLLVGAACLALALAIAGCGGGGGSSSSSISKSAFLKQGNQICQRGNKQINAAGQKAFPRGQQPSKSELVKFFTATVIPNVQSQINQLRALGAPNGDEDQVNAILDAAQSGLDTAKKDPSSLASRGGGDPFAKANRLAKSYGLTACGSG